MGNFFGLIVFIILAIAGASIARRYQEGSISPFQIAKWQRQGWWLGLLLVAVIFVASSIVSVPVGNRLVVYNQLTKGFRKPLSPGYGLVLPMINERIMYDVRTQVYTMSDIVQEGNIQRADAIEVLSNDGLKMDLDITVQYYLDPDSLNDLHDSVGVNYVDKIIRPNVREAIRNEFAQYEATEAYSSKREEIKVKLFERMRDALAENNIICEDVLIRNIALPPTVVAAIELKKAAQQDSERMQYILEKERQEKDRIKIEAEAQAERIEIVNNALASNPNYLKWLAIDKLNDNIELVITDGKTILNLDALSNN